MENDREKIKSFIGGEFYADWHVDRIVSPTQVFQRHLYPLMGKPNLKFLEIGSFEG